MYRVDYGDAGTRGGGFTCIDTRRSFNDETVCRKFSVRALGSWAVVLAFDMTVRRSARARHVSKSEITSILRATHWNKIFPRKTSEGFIRISSRVSAIVRSVIPMGVTQFSLRVQHVGFRPKGWRGQTARKNYN